MRQSWEYITEQATNTDKLNLDDRVSFQYFNPNGLVAQKRANDNKITEMIDAGLVKSGWHIAYGTFADYWVKNVYELVQKKRLSRRAVRSAEDLLREHVLHVAFKIFEITGVETEHSRQAVELKAKQDRDEAQLKKLIAKFKG